MSRRFPWKNKPSEHDQLVIAQCLTPSPSFPTLFLLSEVGATQFIIQSSSLPPVKHRVLIGDSQRCSCNEAKEGVRLCGHLMFVMLKVMRLKETSALVWQLSLTETEVGEVVKGRYEWKAERKGKKRERKEENKEQLTVQRKPIEADDVCVVCQEEMTSPLGLTYCDHGCGNALHARCMRVWAEHQAQTCKSITCPMCRSDWSKRHDFTLIDLLHQLKQRETTTPSNHPPSSTPSSKPNKRRVPSTQPTRRCRSCHQSIPPHHPLYRCVHCSFHLCRSCFPRPTQARDNSGHMHVLVQRVSQASGVSWTAPPAPVGDGLLHLQDRELSAADYDLLLQLDQHRGQPLYSYLSASLPQCEVNDDDCALCSTSVEGMRRSLPCGDVAHHACLSSSIMYDGGDVKCSRCQAPVFPGLHSFTRRRRPVKRVEREAVEEEDKVEEGVGFEVSGSGVVGLRVREGEEKREAEGVVSVSVVRSKGRRRSGHPQRGAGAGALSSVPCLPPIQLLSLSTTKLNPSSSLPPAPVPSTRPQHKSTTSTLPLSILPSVSVTPQPHPHTAPLPSPEHPKRGGRLHRGLPRLHRQASDGQRVGQVSKVSVLGIGSGMG